MTDRSRGGLPSLPAALGRIGPGIAIAATGVGAGDLVAAAVGGMRHGAVLAWCIVLGALLKFALTEGIARWQLGSGETLLVAIARRAPRPVALLLLAYILVWTPAVAVALAAACGLAAASLWQGLGVAAWGSLHAVAGVTVVLLGSYAGFERAMKGMVAVMFVTIVGSAAWFAPSPMEAARGLLIPSLPADSVLPVLSLMGGVGGSVTLLAYGYWIAEKGWRGAGKIGLVRLDLGLAYLLTGLFGVAVLWLAAAMPAGEAATGGGLALLIGLADRLGITLGPMGRWTFLAGVWAAVATSLLGVWDGVPRLLDDFLGALRGPSGEADPAQGRRRRVVATLFIGVTAALLVHLGRPLWLIFAYTVIGAFFLPFLAGCLLYLNRRGGPLGRTLGNGMGSILLLGLALLLFLYLGFREVAGTLLGAPG